MFLLKRVLTGMIIPHLHVNGVRVVIKKPTTFDARDKNQGKLQVFVLVINGY